MKLYNWYHYFVKTFTETITVCFQSMACIVYWFCFINISHVIIGNQIQAFENKIAKISVIFIFIFYFYSKDIICVGRYLVVVNALHHNRWTLYLYCDESTDILNPYLDETRDIRSNIPLRLKDFLKAEGYIQPYIPSRVLIQTVYHFNNN